MLNRFLFAIIFLVSNTLVVTQSSASCEKPIGVSTISDKFNYNQPYMVCEGRVFAPAVDILNESPADESMHHIEFKPGSIKQVNEDYYYGIVESGWVVVNGIQFNLEQGTTAGMRKEKPVYVRLTRGSVLSLGENSFDLFGNVLTLNNYILQRLYLSSPMEIKVGVSHFEVARGLFFDKNGKIVRSEFTKSSEDLVLGGQLFVPHGEAFVAKFDGDGHVIGLEGVLIKESKSFTVAQHRVGHLSTPKRNQYDFGFDSQGELIFSWGRQSSSVSFESVLVLSIQNQTVVVSGVAKSRIPGVLLSTLHPESQIIILKDTANNDVDIRPGTSFCIDSADKVINCPI